MAALMGNQRQKQAQTMAEREAEQKHQDKLGAENRAAARKRMAEMSPAELKAYVPYARNLGIEVEAYTLPAEIKGQAETQQENLQKAFMQILAGGTGSIPAPFTPAEHKTMQFAGLAPEEAVGIPEPTEQIISPEAASRLSMQMTPEGIAGAVAKPEAPDWKSVDTGKGTQWVKFDTEGNTIAETEVFEKDVPSKPPNLQSKLRLTIKEGIVYEQDAVFNPETGDLTLKGEERKSSKNIEAQPNVTQIGTNLKGDPVFMATRLDKEGKPVTLDAEGNPYKGPLYPAQKARLSPEAQKFQNDLVDIGENVKGIKDFMSLKVKGPDGKPIFKRNKKGKIMFDKSLTGPFQGRGRAIMAYLVNDPRFAAFRQKVGRLRAIVYGLSGKQINQSELQWLQKEILPRFSQPDENFIAVLEEVMQWVEQKRKGSEAAYESMGYIVGGPSDESLEGTVGSLLGVEVNPLDKFWK